MRSLVELKRQFLDDLILTRGRSKKTVENYNRYVDRFLSFIKVKTVSQLTEERIVMYIEYLTQLGDMTDKQQLNCLKPKTQNFHLSALRMFLRFLRTQGYAVPSPNMVKLNVLLVEQPKTVSSEILDCFVTAPSPKTIEEMRDIALIALLFETGLRTSELCALSLVDLCLNSRELTISSRNGKENIWQVSPKTLHALTSYINARDDSSSALFVRYGRKVNDGTDRRIHPRAVQRLIKKRALAVGVTDSITPQAIRSARHYPDLSK